MIKSSSHILKFSNPGKLQLYHEFLEEASYMLSYFVDFIWDNYYLKDEPVPMFITYDHLELPDHDLSARAIKCIATQARGIVKGVVSKNEKIKYVNKTKGLELPLNKVTKPVILKNNPIELNSICVELVSGTTEFDQFLVLKSIGKKYGRIYLPVKNHRHSNKLRSQSIDNKPMTSFLIRYSYVDFRWKLPDIKKKSKKTGKIVGCDQGINKVVVLSDGQRTTNCNHDHSFKSIIEKLSRKKKGSKSFKKVQQHRTNYINWCINQLDLDDICEIRLEKLFQVRYKQRTNRFLSHFTYTIIRDKIKTRCEGSGVHFTEMPNRYRSQRCFECGYVHTNNRKKEEFICLSCGVIEDADLNAAKNNSIILYDIPPVVWKEKWNRTSGFYWLKNSVSLCSDSIVPDMKKE